MGARLALLVARWSCRMHVTTDPMCVHYRAPRHRSHLDKASRGISCRRCGIHVRTIDGPDGPLSLLSTTRRRLSQAEADRIKQAWLADDGASF